MNHELQNLIDKYRATGRIVFVYPRKKRISLNGGRATDYATAAEKMNELLNTTTEQVIYAARRDYEDWQTESSKTVSTHIPA